MNDGTATYTIKYNFLPLSPTVDQLCADQAGSADPCPLAGDAAAPVHHEDRSVSVFPDLKGSISSKIEWKTAAGEQILCMTWTFSA